MGIIVFQAYVNAVALTTDHFHVSKLWINPL